MRAELIMKSFVAFRGWFFNDDTILSFLLRVVFLNDHAATDFISEFFSFCGKPFTFLVRSSDLRGENGGVSRRIKVALKL